MDIELNKSCELADTGYEVSNRIYIAAQKHLLPLISEHMNIFDEKQRAIVETFLRSYDYMGSIIEMKGYSNYQSLAAAVRSMMELLFDIHMLRLDATGVLIKKRDDFFSISELADAEEVVKFYDEHNIPHDDTCMINKSFLGMSNVVRKQTENNSKCKGTASFSRLKKDGKNHWSGMSMFERAEKLDKKNGGVKYRLMYKKFSGSLNSYVHSGYVIGVEREKERLLTTYGFIHNLAQEVFHESSKKCTQCLRLSINEAEIANAISAIDEVYENGIDKLESMKRTLFNS